MSADETPTARAIRLVREDGQAAVLIALREKLAEMELHEETADPLDVGYMAAWQEVDVWLRERYAGLESEAPASPAEPEAVCSRCHAPKGLHAVGQSCNNNCGGRVIVNRKASS